MIADIASRELEAHKGGYGPQHATASPRSALYRKAGAVVSGSRRYRRPTKCISTIILLACGLFAEVSQVSDCKALLDSILDDVAITIRLLSVYQPEAVDAAEPAQKRARVNQ